MKIPEKGGNAVQHWSVPALREALAQDREALIQRSEDNYTGQVSAVAGQIARLREERPFILVCGPSGSGKTTTSYRLETLLDEMGCETVTVSMDNYFLPHDAGALPVDEEGKPDYESPDRLDIPLLQQHLHKLHRLEPVEVPRFDFATQSRLPGVKLARKPGELVLLEGIHTLNPYVMGDIMEVATDIYVILEDDLVLEDGHILPASRLRLLRRLVRDRLFRGSSVAGTLERYASVSRGERRNIFPFAVNADERISTFLPYEIAVYSGILRPDADQLPDDLRALVLSLDDLPASLSPTNSLVREVCGGSIYEY